MRLFCRGDKQHGNIQSTLPKEQNTCFSFYYILAFLRVYWQRVQREEDFKKTTSNSCCFFVFCKFVFCSKKKKKIGLSNVSSVFTCLANEVILKQRKAVATRERGKMDVAAKILHLQPCGTEKLHRNPLSLKTGHQFSTKNQIFLSASELRC